MKVEPVGVSFLVEPDETIMDAATRCGIRWPTICHGNGDCSVCYLRVLSGAPAVVPPTSREEELLAPIRALAGVPPEVEIRLACQTRISGDVVVWKPGVRPEE